MIASAATGTAGGAYSIPVTSAAVNRGLNSAAPATDFFGNPRARTNDNPADVGAVECQGTACTGPVPTPIASVTGGPLAFGNVVNGTTSPSLQLVLHNTGNASLTGIILAFSSPRYSRPAGTAGGTCTGTLTQGNTCTINVVFSPNALAAVTETLTITGNATVTGSPVSLTGTGVAATYTATVSPSPLAFGNWAAGTTSSVMNLTVANTGNSQLTGLTYTFGGGTPQPFSRVTGGTFPAGVPNCGANLNVGASCTVKVQFLPATAVAFSRTMTLASTAAGTLTSTAATLTGTGVAARSAVSISAPTITLLTGAATGTGLVTFTNNGAAGSSQVNVTNIAVSGGSPVTYLFNVGALLAGPDTCTGVPLAPGASCTVTVRFTNANLLGGAPRGFNRTGTITFTDTGLASPQSTALTGFATP
jgi:hypothetical protein